ncbi:MAG: hypothetical protein C4536_15255 [Actinobacteria bacterium]|nr:MAG: hypothetical protein C4536_15255 [Actinomycetota bacterium]
MKRILILLVTMACIATLVLLAGCGDSSGKGAGSGGGEDVGNGTGEEQVEVIDGEERKITVEEPQEEGESGKVTLEGENGEETTIEVEEQVPSEESLGAPIYPGSEYVEGSGVSGTTTSGDKELTASGAEFTTKDDISKVVSWYKGKLGEPMAASPEVTTWMFQGQDKAVTTVIVEPFEGKTKITIAKVSGDVDINI